MVVVVVNPMGDLRLCLESDWEKEADFRFAFLLMAFVRGQNDEPCAKAKKQTFYHQLSGVL